MEQNWKKTIIFKQLREFFIILLFITLLLLLFYSLGIVRTFKIEISNVKKDTSTENFDVSNLDLINSFYEKEGVYTVNEFPPSYIKVLAKGLPFLHSRNLCLSLDLKTEDDWDLTYNREFSSPLYRKDLAGLSFTQIGKLFLYPNQSECVNLQSCLNNDSIQYIDLLTDQKSKPEVYKNLLKSLEGEDIIFQGSTKILGETRLFFFFDADSYVDLTFSGMLEKGEDFAALIEIENLATGRKVYSRVINEQKTLPIKNKDLKLFKTGWYSIDVKYGKTEHLQLISQIKTNSYFSTSTEVTIGPNSEMFSYSEYPTEILLYSNDEILKDTEVRINDKTFTLTGLITKDNPLIINLGKGLNLISSSSQSLRIIGNYFSPSKDSLKAPYEKIFLTEEMKKSGIKADLIISNFKQRGSNSTLCFNDDFYKIFNHSNEHEFLLTNLNLLSDIGTYTSLLEYDFKRLSLNENYDFWYGGKQVEPSSAKILYSNISLDKLPEGIRPEELRNTLFDEFSEAKVIYKYSTEPSYINNLAIFTLDDR